MVSWWFHLSTGFECMEEAFPVSSSFLLFAALPDKGAYSEPSVGSAATTAIKAGNRGPGKGASDVPARAKIPVPALAMRDGSVTVAVKPAVRRAHQAGPVWGRVDLYALSSCAVHLAGKCIHEVGPSVSHDLLESGQRQVRVSVLIHSVAAPSKTQHRRREIRWRDRQVGQVRCQHAVDGVRGRLRGAIRN